MERNLVFYKHFPSFIKIINLKNTRAGSNMRKTILGLEGAFAECGLELLEEEF